MFSQILSVFTLESQQIQMLFGSLPYGQWKWMANCEHEPRSKKQVRCNLRFLGTLISNHQKRLWFGPCQNTGSQWTKKVNRVPFTTVNILFTVTRFWQPPNDSTKTSFPDLIGLSWTLLTFCQGTCWDPSLSCTRTAGGGGNGNEFFPRRVT